MKKERGARTDRNTTESKYENWTQEDQEFLCGLNSEMIRLQKEMDSIVIRGTFTDDAKREVTKELANGEKPTLRGVWMQSVMNIDDALDQSKDERGETETSNSWRKTLEEARYAAMKKLEILYKKNLLNRERKRLYERYGREVKDMQAVEEEIEEIGDFIGYDESQEEDKIAQLRQEVEERIREQKQKNGSSIKKRKVPDSKEAQPEKITAKTPYRNASERRQEKNIKTPDETTELLQRRGVDVSQDLIVLSDDELRDWIVRAENALKQVDGRLKYAKEIKRKLAEATALVDRHQADDSAKSEGEEYEGVSETTRRKLDSFFESFGSLASVREKVKEQERKLAGIVSDSQEQEEAERLLGVMKINLETVEESVRTKGQQLERTFVPHIASEQARRFPGTKSEEFRENPEWLQYRIRELHAAISKQKRKVAQNRTEKERLLEALKRKQSEFFASMKKIEQQSLLPAKEKYKEQDMLRLAHEDELGRYEWMIGDIEVEERKLEFLKTRLEEAEKMHAEPTMPSGSEPASGAEPGLEPEFGSQSEPKPAPDVALRNQESEDREDREGEAEEKIFTSALNRLEEEFGIDLEALETIEGFEKLSEGQQLMVVENLRQITLGRIREEAETAVDESNAETIGKRGRLLGSFWNFISKHHRTAKAEKEVVATGLRGGIERHGEVLQALVSGMERKGPKVEYDDIHDELNVVYLEADGNCTEEEKDAIRSFNEIANEFARLPHEWGYETASKKERGQYEDVRTTYEANLSTIRDLAATRNDPTLIALTYDVRAKVEMNQLLNTHPEVGEYLADIENRSVLGQVFKKSVLTRPGEGGISAISFGLGFARKSLVAGIVAAGAAPFVAGAAFVGAAGVGGYWIAKNRVREQNQKRSSNARRGRRDGSSESAEFISSANLSEKLKRLTERIRQDINREDELTPEERKTFAKNVRLLRTRIQFTRQKLEEGRVDFGERSTRLARQAELTECLSYASSFSEALDMRDSFRSEGEPLAGDLEPHEEPDERQQNIPAAMMSQEKELPSQWNTLSGDPGRKMYQWDEEVENRLADFLDYRRERRDKRARRQVLIGTGITAGAMTAGMLFRDAVDSGVFGNGEHIDRASLEGERFFEPQGSEVATGMREAGIASGIGSETVAESTGVATPEPGGGVSSGSVFEAAVAVPESPETIPESFTVRVESGDGLTNLARKATQDYLEARGGGELPEGLTAEHLVYVEDALRRQIEISGTLHPGDSVEIGRDAIERAIAESRGLTDAQLENLASYADRVKVFDNLPRVGEAETTVPDLELSSSSSSQAAALEAYFIDNPDSIEAFIGVRESLSERLFGEKQWETYVSDVNRTGNFFATLDNELESGVETSQLSAQDLKFGQFVVAAYENLNQHIRFTDSAKIDELLLPGTYETTRSYIDRISFVLMTRGITDLDVLLGKVEGVNAEKMVQFFVEKGLVEYTHSPE